ncbi:MAG: hypothetical protein IH841_03860 [Thaumarchaeota archaeon]|nr:hypothetical protein [Nitrososphaerota archaeon]
MSGTTWLGGIYLRGGGHKIVLRALNHYKNRVENVGTDPQLKETAITLRSLVVEEGKKNSEQVQLLMKLINAGLNDPKLINQSQFQVPLIKKALNCYQIDIEKIVKNMQERYFELFDEPKNLQNELPLIKEALTQINKFG